MTWEQEVVGFLYWECGYSLNQIAAELDLPAATAHYWLTDGRDKRRRLRPPVEARAARAGRKGVLADLNDELRAALRAERSANQTARDLAVSPSAVTRAWQRIGG